MNRDPDRWPTDPMTLFADWFEEAGRHEGVRFPEAACLATIDDEGYPDARMVLIKEFGARGFVFYTNRDSAKGRSLRARPRAALNLYWDPLDRQVRVQGPVAPVTNEEADTYFATRPRESQLAAWASAQSRTLADRSELETRFQDAARRFEGSEVPRPPHWSGFRIRPFRIEFWISGAHRLHHRVLYRLSEGVAGLAGRDEGAGPAASAWTRELLYP